MEDPQPLFDPSRPPFGHALFTDALVSAIEGGRVAHGWLLTGPQGVGKSAMACMAAAWMLRETEGQTSFVETTGMVVDPNDPGSNLVCKGHHPDLLVIRPEIKDNKSGQIKLDQIRKLVGFLGHKPGRGGWRVAIIDSMDQVNRNGANALLKLLEEPPERTLLFLIASRPGRLPPTVRSRCRVVRIPALDGENCRTIVANAMPEEPEGRISARFECGIEHAEQGAVAADGAAEVLADKCVRCQRIVLGDARCDAFTLGECREALRDRRCAWFGRIDRKGDGLNRFHAE
jgi:DNA polymerase-3 subunit delta'